MDQRRDASSEEGVETLRKAGLTPWEIKRLACFRRTFRHSEMDLAPLDPAHLRFIRWLVAHGKLTDQLR